MGRNSGAYFGWFFGVKKEVVEMEKRIMYMYNYTSVGVVY